MSFESSHYDVNLESIKFNYIFYKTHHVDLVSLNINELENHYICHGRKEYRLFCPIPGKFNWLKYYLDNKLQSKNINEIWKHYLYNYYINACKHKQTQPLGKHKTIIQFNNIFYKNVHPDLIMLNDNDLYLHYHNHGREEKRTFTNIIPHFNFIYYCLIYNLQSDSVDSLWKHYIYDGIIENKFINYNIIIEFNYNNLNENQLFVYKKLLPKHIILPIDKTKREPYKQIMHSKALLHPNKLIKQKYLYDSNIATNNSNINYASNGNIPKTAIIYVYYNRPGELRNESNLAFFIQQTVIRDKTNIYLFIINGGNCEVIFPQQNNLFVLQNRNCYDFEAYGIGINYLKQKFGQNLNGIERIVTMNCGITGPFYNNNNNWLLPFENKLKQNNAYNCSTIIYRINRINSNPDSDIRTPGYFNYFVKDISILNQLMNNVFIRHITKDACICNGEYGLGKIFIQNNKKITSIINNYSKTFIHGWRGDRDNNINNFTVFELIFVKINWRGVDGIKRDSVPVKFQNTILEMNKMCNYKNPLEEKFNNINYNLLKINSRGECYTSSYNWNSKQDFYNKFGRAEEFIIYPTINNFSKVALYAHSDKNNLFRDYCINAVNTLSLLNYRVIILTTCRTFNNIHNLPYEKIIIPEAKTDIYMYQKYLNTKSNTIFNYSHLLLVNDTLVFPIHGINNMSNSITNIINTCDYFGIWNSSEHKEHIISSFLHFNSKLINELKNYFNKYNILQCSTAGNLNSVQMCEINLVSHFSSLGYRHKTIVNYKTISNNDTFLQYQCPIFHPNVFPLWINKPEVFAIKWKYMGNYINKQKLNIPCMNYLLRYIHFNHTGPKGKPEEHNCYGVPAIQ